MSTSTSSSAVFLTTDAVLSHWQGHRRLTRRVIEAFPEDQLFTFSLGGMRPFGVLVLEMITMGVPMIRGIVTGEWDQDSSRGERPKADILRLWDDSTEQINELWKQVPAGGFQKTIKAFGQYEGVAFDLTMYVIDNEIHHRGQGYVYLRALGIEPPAFYER